MAGWKWELLANSLPASMLLKMAGITINLRDEEYDGVGWLDPNSNIFSVRSAYKTLRKENTNDIWKG